MDTELDEALAQRVRLLRKLYGMTQAEWSEFTGIAYKKWNHYERGYPVSRESLYILRKRVGVSADWLYFNDITTVSISFLNLLRHLEQEERTHTLKPLNGSKKPRKRKRSVSATRHNPLQRATKLALAE